MPWKVGTGNSRRNVRLAPQHSSTQVIKAFYYSKGNGDGTCSRQRSRRSRRGRWGHPEGACFLVSLLRSRRGGRGPGPGPGARGPGPAFACGGPPSRVLYTTAYFDLRGLVTGYHSQDWQIAAKIGAAVGAALRSTLDICGTGIKRRRMGTSKCATSRSGPFYPK